MEGIIPMQHTVTEQQLDANRANAARSTGPRTPEGKHRSSQNARKHGFTASTFAVVRLEDVQEVASLKEDLIDLYHPVNSQELFALERAALAQQSILRGARLEAGFFTTCLNESFDPTMADQSAFIRNLVDRNSEITDAQTDNYLLGAGFYRLTRQSNGFSLLLRYQAQAERQYRRAIEEFDRLKALREELPIEPVCEAQPEQTEPLNTVEQTNPSSPENPDPPPTSPAPVAGLNLEPAGDSGIPEVPPTKAPSSQGANAQPAVARVPAVEAGRLPGHQTTEPLIPPVLSGA